ncbi:MAG: alpha/beta hydrolase [Victivallales bacterium]|jgi:acetyl esterase/lipase|nr:alpha/beta hydrolase [Victivallales bacterium]
MVINDWTNFFVPNAELYKPVKIFDYIGDNDSDQTLYITVPKGEAPCPALIWFHGGGFVGGSREIATDFYNGKFAMIEARYRLSPKFPVPCALSDGVAAVARVMKNAEEWGIDPGKIFLGGMSAGAWLAAMVGMDGKLLAKHGCDHRKLSGLLISSGQMTTHFQFKADMGYDTGAYEPVIDDFAPLAHLSKDLPPILLITGESGLDIPARPEENAFLAASLKAIGHTQVSCYHLKGCDHSTVLDHSGKLFTEFIAEIAGK